MGEPGLIADARPFPDGRAVLVEHVHEPFFLFGTRMPLHSLTVYERGGGPLREIAWLPLTEDVPTAIGWVSTGPRSIAWRADAPATPVWVDVLANGDVWEETAYRDAVLEAPFHGSPVSLVTLPLR